MGTRVAVGVWLALALLAGSALAQEGPVTTLMRPQPLGGSAPLGRLDTLSRQNSLFGDTPLSTADTLSGERPARRRDDAGDPATPGKPGDQAAACDDRTGTRRRATPGTAYGGSGPGEYGRFVDGGRTPDTKPPSPPPGAAAPRKPGDQPLYGGTDRPLWSDPAKSAAEKQAPSAPGAARDERAPAAATPGVDRPLWADAGAARPAADGCDPAADPNSSTRRAGVADTPTQTLFFGTVPTR